MAILQPPIIVKPSTMTKEHKTLWNKLKEFQFESPNALLKFSTRLARENGWSQEYADRVVLEYKKFIFMCCVGKKSVTPSDEVDQAWHLHLTYTHSYWVDMFAIIGKRIHHNPTEGGQKEIDKYDTQYNYTRDLYQLLFNEDQPLDIWLPNKKRFSDRFIRININDNWIIKKPKFFIKLAATVAFLLTVLSFIQGSSTNDYGSDDFWGWFFIGVGVVALIIFVLYMITPSDKNNKGKGGSSGSGCSSGGWFIFGGSGCSSGDSHSSGCSAGSGCGSSCGSGCGGGCGGGCSS